MNITPTAISTAILGLAEKDIRRYSIAEAIQDFLDHKRSTGFYREMNQAVARRKNLPEDNFPTGFSIPHDVIIANTRDLIASDATKGGYSVGTSNGSMIDTLRTATLAKKLGAQFITDLQDNLDYSRKTNGVAVAWLDESSSVTPSDQTFDQLSLRLKRLVGQTIFTKQLFAQTAGAIEQMVRDDITTALATELDRAAFNGSGYAGQPRGILQTPNIKTVTFGGAASYAKFLQAARLSDVTNVTLFNPSFVLTPASKEKALGTARFTGGGTAILSDDSRIGTTPADFTNQLPNDRMIYGANWSDLIVGEWPGFDVTVDFVTLAATGRIRLTIELRCDVNVRHPESFCASTDSAAQ